MRYREMMAEDYEAASRLWGNTAGMGLSRADSREGIIQFLGRNPGMSQVCETENGTLAGTVLCGHDGRRGYLYHVAVSTVCRGKGAGREMVTRALSALREAGIAKCHLMVIEGNRPGRSFWSGTGWEERDGIVLFSQNT
ncbi:GCN5 family acetyltransferase [Paenibacillus sp. FSL R7-0273]|uniref:GNAT family N-acetyltransferase n=1 Tax=Paenibacillus sp. FSL R7-0273 TaxID=1536772 RepID=UPI0004F5B950|nr:GNAT family N-acetyltransferase [Paenibacillus sp. FSL R7-0273]AIQ44808.1 GCN5 family acetyltransferase [Paenibacillus sp. FSL R7-0273]OMF93331.1 GNAT family N-acetyltransferase [Paenibacillus sp. FSL R7-0273]